MILKRIFQSVPVIPWEDCPVSYRVWFLSMTVPKLKLRELLLMLVLRLLKVCYHLVNELHFPSVQLLQLLVLMQCAVSALYPDLFSALVLAHLYALHA